MLDMISALVFFGFFGLLIYATIIRRPSMGKCGGSGEALLEARAKGPSPVGLYCEICGEHAGIVSTKEYQRLTPPVYCASCKIVIERYEARRC